MNYVFKFQKLVLITLASLFLFACSKEDNQPAPNDNTGEIIETIGQISVEDFDIFEGEIGVALDARPIARKGYLPTQVTINVNATNGNFTQTVPIDQFSFMGQLKIPLEGLSDAAKQELIDGVVITPEYKDASGNILFTEPSSTVSFQSNPNARIANASTLVETEANQTLFLSGNTTYYIQRMNTDGSPDNGAWRHLTDANYGQVISANASEFNGNEPDRGFSFIPIPGEFNTFAIRHVESLRYVQVTTILQFTLISNTAPNLSNRTSFTQIQGSSDYNNFKFKFEKQDDGTYVIKTYDGMAIKQAEGYGLTVQNSINNPLGQPLVTSEDRKWRIVSTHIDWNVTNIGTSFLEPILPKAETGFSFNSTLTNCGSGSLSQTVGADITETRSRTVGWEESLSMSTSNTVNVSATVSVGFEAKFFGTGGDYNLSLTAGYSHTWSSTSENSNWEDNTNTMQQNLFSERTVTVPSGSASLVYDVYQFYPETKVNFVQRMRVEGIDSDTGAVLTGNEIRTQFYISGFNGVITSIEPTSIVITLKGTVTLDKVIQTESDVQDVPANCN